MKTITILISIFLLTFCFQLFGQERVNRTKLSFDKKSEVITKAIGYAYNPEIGEWVDYENVISSNKDFKEKYKVLQGGFMMSKTRQNFISLQTRTLSYNGINYCVLVIERWDGEYEYPALKEDWYFYKKTDGYIYEESYFKKIEKFDDLKTKNIVSIGSKYEEYDETKFLDLIQTNLSEKKGEYDETYTFCAMKSKEGLIRFILPRNIKYDNSYFDKEYFELGYNDFSKLFLK